MTLSPFDAFNDDSNIFFLDWKIQIVAILKSLEINSNVYQYLCRYHCVDLMVKMWKNMLLKENITVINYSEVDLTLDLLGYLLIQSVNIGHFGLMDEMYTSHAYECLFKIVVSGPYNPDTMKAKVSINTPFYYKHVLLTIFKVASCA